MCLVISLKFGEMFKPQEVVVCIKQVWCNLSLLKSQKSEMEVHFDMLRFSVGEMFGYDSSKSCWFKQDGI